MIKNIKAVLFDLGGVVLPQPQKAIAAYGRNLGLPPSFLPKVFTSGVPNNSFCKLETGVYTTTEFYKMFEKEANQIALDIGLTLPVEFSAEKLFHSFQSAENQNSDIVKMAYLDVISAAVKLQKNGIKTCILTNNWISDKEPEKGRAEHFMLQLKFYFGEVVQSSHINLRKPDPLIYLHACNKLGVRPQETAFLDDIGLNLKAAQKLGISCIKVVEPMQAVKDLEKLTGLSLCHTAGDCLFPPPCKPNNMSHCYAKVSADTTLHYIDAGEGPVVILLHGFPDTWYGWRHQIPALVCAGYRVIVPDQRGYGDSISSTNMDDYNHKQLCSDILNLMDVIGVAQATVVGHDWGGSIAWALALVYPNRFNGVCGVNTPFYPINPKQSPLVSMQKNPGVFDYQLYFMEPGNADREFESDIKRSISIMFQAFDSKLTLKASDVRKRGGMFVGAPPNIKPGRFLTDEELNYYVQQFEKSGFTGPLNWYRNYELTWNWLRHFAGRKISIPALMVTASHDVILKPRYTEGMENRIHKLDRLHIKNCSHWTGQECPDQLNDGLIKWLKSIHTNESAPNSRL
uniref:Bifunctional epoxide hydrolase 2-like n=1 Tax=Phallusia mammillata TaxID=59560 RepID=A0A6F9DC00_9ASCI|nr:bifunctional epoxide hydrolase 2-like [Phallusia mammillata]